MATPFTSIYNRFLGKVTDDMYMELTPQDTLRDLQKILLEALPGFEFPRFNLYDYTIGTESMSASEVPDNAFVISEVEDLEDSNNTQVEIDVSCFNIDLTTEEINIIAILMMNVWLQRQITSIENIRMKYSGSDFKMTSQANHLSKLLSLSTECRRDSLHMQRLYKRRRVSQDGGYESNWDVLRESNVLGY